MGHRFALIDSFSPRLIADNLRQFYLIYPKAKGQRAFDYTEEHSRKEIHVRSLVHEKWYQQTTGLNGLRKKKQQPICFCLHARERFSLHQAVFEEREREFASFIRSTCVLSYQDFLLRSDVRRITSISDWLHFSQ